MGPIIKFAKSDSIQYVMEHVDRLDNGTFVWVDDTERLYIKMRDKLIAISPAHRKLIPFMCKNEQFSLSIKP